MRFLILTAGIAVGVAATLYLKHPGNRLLWWIFTTDLRASAPHLYGRGSRV